MARWYSSKVLTLLLLSLIILEILDVKKTPTEERLSRKGFFHPALGTDFSVSLATTSALKGLGRAVTLWL